MAEQTLAEQIKAKLIEIYADISQIKSIVSGEKYDAKAVFINLALVDDKDKFLTASQPTSHEQLFKLKKPVPINALFYANTNPITTHNPHRLTITGVAGSGKTTLCQYLSRQYSLAHTAQADSRLRITHIPWVFWLPFRRIKSDQYINHTFLSLENTIAKVIYYTYFERTDLLTNQVDRAQLIIAELTTLLNCPQDVLLILDGFDEIADKYFENPEYDEKPVAAIYRDLLNYPHNIVVARPSSLDKIPQKNKALEFQNVGFTKDNMERYLHTFYPKESFKNLVFENRKVYAMAHVPINLGLLCLADIGNNANGNSQEDASCAHSMSRLYQFVIMGLIKRHKTEKDTSIHYDNCLKHYSRIAFEKLRAANNNYHLTEQEVDTYFKDDTAYLEIGLLNKKGAIWEFAHTTLQEYLAAYYLSTHINQPILNKQDEATFSYQDAVKFIRANKYESRYEIFWWFTSGVMSDTAAKDKDNYKGLHRFLACFLKIQPPSELKLYRDALHMRILEEGPIVEGLMISGVSPSATKIKTIKLITTEISRLQTGLIESITQYSPENLEKIYSSLSLSSHLFCEYGFVEKLINFAQSPSQGVWSIFSSTDYYIQLKKKAIISLGLIGLYDDAIIRFLAPYLESTSDNFKPAAAQALLCLGYTEQKGVKVLIEHLHQDKFLTNYLQSVNWHHSEEAAHRQFYTAVQRIIQDQCKFSLDHFKQEQAISFVNNLFQLLSYMSQACDDDFLKMLKVHAKTANEWLQLKVVAFLLGVVGEQTLFNLKKFLIIAAKLYQMTYLKEAVAKEVQEVFSQLNDNTPLLTILRNWQKQMPAESWEKFLQSGYLLLCPKNQEQGFAKWFALLNAMNLDVQSSVAEMLVQLGKTDKRVVDTLCGLLKFFLIDSTHIVEVLVQLVETDKKMVDVLWTLLKDRDPIVRSRALDILVKLAQEDNQVVDTLCALLKDSDLHVRSCVAEALVQLRQVDKQVVDVFCVLLEDRSLDVRNRAADVLRKIEQIDAQVVDTLCALHQNRYSDVRSLAADVLGKIERPNKQVIDVLCTLLEDIMSDVRSHAADALGKIEQPDKQVINALCTLFKDIKPDVRSRAADALGKIEQPDKQVVDALCTLLEDSDPDVRSRAADALGKIEQPDKQVVDALCTLLEDNDPDVRSRAADALGKIEQPDKQVVDALCTLLEDNDPEVRSRAVDALGNIEQPDKQVINALCTLLEDINPDVRFGAVGALVQLGQEDNQVVDTLCALLTDKNVDMRFRAVKVLVQLGQAVKPVVNMLCALLVDRYPDVRSRAADILVQLGKTDTQMVDALCAFLLKSTDSYIHSRAAEVLVKIGKTDKQVIDALCTLLKDSDLYVRSCAAEALVQLGQVDSQVVDVLCALFKGSQSYIRYRVAQVLGKIEQPDKQVVNALYTLLEDSNSDVRSLAADALGKIEQPDKQVVDALCTLLEDSYPEVRFRAAVALVQLSQLDKKVIDVLFALLENADQGVRFRAAKSLSLLNDIPEPLLRNILAAFTALADKRLKEFLLLKAEIFAFLVKTYETHPNLILELFIQPSLVAINKLLEFVSIQDLKATNITEYIRSKQYNDGEHITLSDEFELAELEGIVVALTVETHDKKLTVEIAKNIEDNALGQLTTLLKAENFPPNFKIKMVLDQLKLYQYRTMVTIVQNAQYPERLQIKVDTLNQILKSQAQLPSSNLPITYLSLCNQGITQGDEKFSVLQQVIKSQQLPYLVVLNLNQNALSLESFAHLYQALCMHQQIQKLSLRMNKIEACEQTLEQMSSEKPPRLKAIDLSQNYLTQSKLFFNEQQGTAFSHGIFKSKPREVGSLLAPEQNISEMEWVIALVCRRGKEHAMLYLEGMGSRGQRFIKRYHIQGSNGKAYIDQAITIKPTSFNPENYYINAAPIKSEQGKSLNTQVKKQLGKPLKFSIWGAYVRKDTSNCLIWCLEQLVNIGLIEKVPASLLTRDYLPSTVAKNDALFNQNCFQPSSAP